MMCQGSINYQGFLHDHFVLAKLATRSIRVKNVFALDGTEIPFAPMTRKLTRIQ